ncbi:hypothetical protein HMPREF7215_2353 [Pyramidobacter piscolens W5455]|uniref:Uncharacterized protein n=1 Tax=Pyramidobacter piscolens W5455 TaxID=352165 RepID=A0ABM9ZUI1_9BACT|nr:hypothetical protein HMPREF7215_2353 [Pyramidobacter piscolens W5455]
MGRLVLKSLNITILKKYSLSIEKKEKVGVSSFAAGDPARVGP